MSGYSPESSKVPPLPPLPKVPAVRRLKEALVARGHHPHGANAIARAVCDPSSARRQLEQPGRLRVDGGYLETIQTAVWIPAVLPYPTNPRVLPAFSYPVEGRADRRSPLPDLLASESPHAVELLLPYMEPAELVGTVDAHLDYLRKSNDLVGSVGRLGIREPLLVVPLVIPQLSVTVVDADDAPAILAAVDGSSRVSAAYAHLNLEPAEVLLKFLSNDRLLRQRIGDSLSMLERADDALTEEDRAGLRVLTAPASIIVGFERDDEESGDLADAISSRLGILHVDPPKPWSQASRFDVQLDVALRALAEAGRISETEQDWLAGRLSPEQTAAAGLSEFADVRAAQLVHQIMPADQVTSRALRSLTVRSRITAEHRAEIAAEGALRAFRSSITDSQATAARSLLKALYRMDELAKPWTVEVSSAKRPTRGKALQQCLEELRTVGGPGPTIRSLLVMSAYWMARFRVVTSATRGGQKDRRDIARVVLLMASTDHGIRQLMQIITDGREGIPPRRVNEAGKFIVAASGANTVVDDVWIRETWPAVDGVEPESPTPPSPEATLQRGRAVVQERFADLLIAIEQLDEPVNGEGTPLVETLGLDPAFVDPLLFTLMDVQGRLLELKRVAVRNT